MASGVNAYTGWVVGVVASGSGVKVGDPTDADCCCCCAHTASSYTIFGLPWGNDGPGPVVVMGQCNYYGYIFGWPWPIALLLDPTGSSNAGCNFAIYDGTGSGWEKTGGPGNNTPAGTYTSTNGGSPATLTVS